MSPSWRSVGFAIDISFQKTLWNFEIKLSLVLLYLNGTTNCCYYMASLVSGRGESNPVLWLAFRVARCTIVPGPADYPLCFFRTLCNTFRELIIHIACFVIKHPKNQEKRMKDLEIVLRANRETFSFWHYLIKIWSNKIIPWAHVGYEMLDSQQD